MVKIVSTLILVVAVIAVQGQAPEYEEVLKAAKAGNFDQVQELEQPHDENQASYNEDDALNRNLEKQAGWQPPLFNSLRELKPQNGGHVYGEAEYAYHSASNVNGRTTEQNAGHKIINDDGRVKEYDFTPSSSYSPHIPSILSPVGQKPGDYVASDYHYQYGGAVSGKPNFANQKLSNNLQQDYYPRNSAIIPIPPKKQPNSTKSGDVEYEYVLTSSTEDDKPPRQINVSAENKFNAPQEAEQDNEIAQTNDQTPVSAGEDEKINNGLTYNIEFDEPPEAKPVTMNDNNNITPTPFEIIIPTEPQFLLRVDDVDRKLKTTPTTVQADDYIYSIPPVFLEENVETTSNSNKENKIKKINKDTQIVITWGDEPTDKPAPVTTTIERKKSKMSDTDYISYVASAIEDRLDKITQQVKKTDFEKLNSDIFPNPTKSAKKERSPLTFTNVRELKPPQGGHVYGEAQYAYHTSSNINGQKSEDAGGHKIINNDGKVKEFNFTPKPKFGPVSYY